MKEMFNIWDAHILFPKLLDANKLEHENDGLIFTIDESPYYPGTCDQILKWKPIELNSIDFNLQPTSHPNCYALRSSEGILFSYAIIQQTEALEYIQKGGVVEFVYDK
jgi:mRNA capping enzyme, catalytic domain